jgi:hypothetical protein
MLRASAEMALLGIGSALAGAGAAASIQDASTLAMVREFGALGLLLIFGVTLMRLLSKHLGQLNAAVRAHGQQFATQGKSMEAMAGDIRDVVTALGQAVQDARGDRVKTQQTVEALPDKFRAILRDEMRKR